jgi:hypothetical protein
LIYILNSENLLSSALKDFVLATSRSASKYQQKERRPFGLPVETPN